MLPFDERIPEEGRQENEAPIAFLRQAYRHPLDDGAREEHEQALLRVRERLLRYEDSEMSGRQTSPLYVVDNQARDTGSVHNNVRFSPELGGKNRIWGVRRRMIMAIAVVVLLVGSMAVLLRAVQQSKSGSGGTHLPVLTEFEGTGSQTLSDLNLALPQGRGVGVDLSC
ncbi:MAG: hypothetical protein J2P36_12230, partial [Ktedonobacteraceae bacterium]|nr:hypothetical protein [Ktedonobacteraceae bacterium]